MHRRLIPAILFLLVSCNLPSPHPAATATTDMVRVPSVVKDATPMPHNEPLPDREKYVLDTVIDYDRHLVIVEETIAYPNRTGQQLDALTLAIAANLWPGCFTLSAVLADGLPLPGYALHAHRLDIPLLTPLAPGSVLTLTLRYSLALPYMDQVHSMRARIFGYSGLQMNLVNWYPFVVPFIDGQWVVREPWSHGEYLVYPAADYEVNLVFTDPVNPPLVASSGSAERIGDFTRYTLYGGRAFAFSISRDFQVSSIQVGDITVFSYYFPLYRTPGEAAMYASAQAVQAFSQRFGAYPHPTLSVVIADFQDSMEFSALYFHSRSFYDLYDGTPANYLTLVAAHETGHQWWFEQVANDQALEPWLDESLTTYSESLFYESIHPQLVSWWWSNRIDFFQPQGDIDIPVYDGQNDDTYKQIVYFNGAHFFRDLRDRIGDPAFFAFLQDYLAQGRGRIVTGGDFFRILDMHTDQDVSDILNDYFKNGRNFLP